MNKEKCSCGKMATWIYAPGHGDGSRPFYCDDCVSRGCSCNERSVLPGDYHPPLTNPDYPEGVENVDWKWVEQGRRYVYLSEGKELPCCEYDWSEDGFDEPPGCPYCDTGKTFLSSEKRDIEYRGKKYTVDAWFYQCDECSRQFTTGELDDDTLSQIPGYMENAAKNNEADKLYNIF